MTQSRRWNIGTAVVVVLVLLAGWLLVISPKRGEAEELRSQAATSEAANEVTEARIRQLKLDQKDLPAKQARIAEIAQKIPPIPELPPLIREIARTATANGVVVTSLTFAEPVASEDVEGTSSIEMSLDVAGEYANLKLFLAQVEEAQRALLVEGFTLTYEEVQSAGQAAETERSSADQAGPLRLSAKANVFIATAVTSGESGGTGGAGAAPTAAPTASPAATEGAGS